VYPNDCDQPNIFVFEPMALEGSFPFRYYWTHGFRGSVSF